MRPDAIIATGRSDYPNQVNNVLGFPFIFRGALDVRARKINEEMKLAAVHALAELARRGEAVPEVVRDAYPGDVLRLRRRTTSSRSRSIRACCSSCAPPSRRPRWRPASRGSRSTSASTRRGSRNATPRCRSSRTPPEPEHPPTMSIEEKIKRLEELNAQAELGGGAERIQRQHASGQPHRARAHRAAARPGHVRRARQVRHAPLHRLRHARSRRSRATASSPATARSTAARSSSSRRTSPCSAAASRARSPRRSAR